VNKHRAARMEAEYRLGTRKHVFVVVSEKRITHRPATFDTRVQVMFKIVDPRNATRFHEKLCSEVSMSDYEIEQFGMRALMKQFKESVRYEGFRRLLPQVESLHLILSPKESP
jgi:hypothetical protein